MDIVRRTWTEISLNAIEHNFCEIKNKVKDAKVCCVIKADGYGHGAAELAKEYEKSGADYFAVSNIDEGKELRENGITLPIVILGYTPACNAVELADFDISQAVYSLEYAKSLNENCKKGKVKIHIKLDTGMSRIGFMCQQFPRDNYYISEIEKNNLSVRQLRERIRNKEYQRLDDKTKLKLINKEEIDIKDNIKNPIIIKNKLDIDKEIVSEKILQRLILEDIPSFLEELGTGYSFIKNEYKIKIGERYNYIDLLLFNIEYNCYVVVELKVTELKKEHIGQIQIYMNYVDKNIKTVNQDKTIGVIICKKDNGYYIEYSSDNRIFSKNYIFS